MLKQTITYENFAGEQVTKDFYFNLTKAELLQLEMRTKNGFAEHLDEVVKSEDPSLIIDAFEKIVLKAYGVKSPDGKQFIKSQEELDKFKFSGAYDQLFVELCQDPESAKAFVQGIFPKNLESPSRKAKQTSKSKKN